MTHSIMTQIKGQIDRDHRDLGLFGSPNVVKNEAGESFLEMRTGESPFSVTIHLCTHGEELHVLDSDIDDVDSGAWFVCQSYEELAAWLIETKD